MAYGKGDTLEAFDAKLADAHMRGQWLSDARRDAGVGGAWDGSVWKSNPRGEPHLWPWSQTEPLLEESGEAIEESFTARRSLIFANPGLERSTTHTINAGIQLIKPGEIAWAHRHSISAIRFVIEGGDGLYTVVDGEPCPMHENDLVLTPNGRWHDHVNETGARALWLDVLDGPLVGMLNQTIFENYGDKRQPVRNEPGGGALRYAWSEMASRLEEAATASPSPHEGHAVDYRRPDTGAPVTPTLGCRAISLPPGFEGEPLRHSASAVYLVVRGAGRTEAGDRRLEWGPRDVFAVPSWARHRHVNASAEEPAVLFSVTDAPALEALGLYRSEPAPAPAV